jgi:uncharacterized Zn-binding protein involved in type VI secretion
LGKPAARIGDMHMCPKETPGTPSVPHVGGPVFSGCPTVLIEGQPAAREGDSCTCVGEPDIITTGSSGVYIGGQPAARMGDQTAHGGKIVAGGMTVMIGEKKIPRVLKKPELNSESEEIKELSPEEKISVINEAIENSIVLLEKKLRLLEQNDFDTLIAFKRWFGKDDEEANGVILERMRRVLKVSKKLSVENFKEINDEKSKTKYAEIYPDDEFFRVFLGDKFWTAPVIGKDSRSGVLIHELSHLNSIGETFDYMRGESDCLSLAKSDPSDALYNADSFEYFVEI